MNNKLSVIMKIRLLFLGVVLSLVALFVVVSCGGSSSVGGLNDILIGNSGGSGSGGGSANITPVPFDDLSNNPGRIFIDPNNDFDGYDDGLYLASGALPFNFSLFNNTFNAGSDIVFCTNGWFSFDSDIYDDDFDVYEPAYYIYDVLFGDTYGPYDSLIAPFWTDLEMDTYSGVGVWYEVVGDAPNRKFIVQYFANDIANEDNKLVFQTILFEGTNDIQFTYAKMEDVNGDDSIGDVGAVDGSGSLIGLFVGNDTSYINLSVYSYLSSSIPSVPTENNEAYYVYFKYNESRNNYDIYTGYVAIQDLNLNVLNPNLRANRNQNVKNKQPRSTNFRYFYRTNTIQEFMNFVNSIRGNRSHR
jgi:hypothetical protein